MTNAIVTLAIGLTPQESQSHQIFSACAKRHGWAFEVMDTPVFNLRPNLLRKRRVGLHLEKFQLSSLLDRYERILYLDSDILLHPDFPDIFSLVKEGQLGCVYDDLGEDRWKREEELLKMEERLEPLPPIDRRYFNSGVFVLDQSHRDLFTIKKDEVVSGRWPEQTLLNYRVLRDGLPVHALDSTFNFLPFQANWENPEVRRSAMIVHYAGEEAKQAMQEDFEHVGKAWRVETVLR